MDERYLSISRVRGLSPSPLATYLRPLIERENPSASDYLRAVLQSLRDDPARPDELRRRAEALLTIATQSPPVQQSAPIGYPRRGLR